MQILINKSGRVVKLTKRERDLLDNASRLLAEIETVTVHEAAENANTAQGAIGQVLILIGYGKEAPL